MDVCTCIGCVIRMSLTSVCGEKHCVPILGARAKRLVELKLPVERASCV